MRDSIAHHRHPARCIGWVFTAVLLFVSTVSAIDIDRLKVQREGPFEFAQKPTLTRQGDQWTIEFETKSFCDVTIAVEDRDGRIVRHLVSGVLGSNLPEPFEKNSRRQRIVWDGKDDLGNYLDDVDRLTVRMSLGLKAQMERTLFWSPEKMSSKAQLLIEATPDGVCVMTQGHGSQVRLYDRSGTYLRTVYPFPAGAIEKVQGLKWRQFPPNNERLPSKLRGHDPDSFLAESGFGEIVSAGGRLLALGERMTSLSTGGEPKGYVIDGPVTSVSVGEAEPMQPTSAAVSPDGKWLYMTGYGRNWSRFGHAFRDWLQGVQRLRLDIPDPNPELFAGKMRFSAEAAGEKQFRCPASVDCDAKGRVYVTDHYNNRIQVFNPDGRLFKTLPFKRPAQIHIDRKTGRLYVFSWNVHIRLSGRRPPNCRGMSSEPLTPSLTVLGPIEKPEKLAAYAVPGVSRGGNYRSGVNNGRTAYAEVDFATDPPTIWLASGYLPDWRGNYWRRMNVRLLVPKDGKLVTVRSFASEAREALARARPLRHGRPHIHVHLVSGAIYIGEHTDPTQVACKSFYELLQIDPTTGRVRLVQMPTDAEDMDFDLLGRVYLRTYNAITRFDPATWHEVPYDYGIERKVYHGAGGGGERPFSAKGAITLPSTRGGMFHMGGFGVSPQGNAVVSCINPDKKGDRRRVGFGRTNGKRGYTPVMFPGRLRGWEVHVFDRYGRLIDDDVAPGTNHSTMVGPVGAEGHYGSGGHCSCYVNGRFALDFYGRSFAPEIDRFRVVVLDTNGNVIMRIGRYGNVDDGMPLIAKGGPPNPRSIGGDEVAIMHAQNVAVHTDLRYVLADIGNQCVRSVKLDYHATERVALKDVQEAGARVTR